MTHTGETAVPHLSSEEWGKLFGARPRTIYPFPLRCAKQGIWHTPVCRQ